MSDTLHNHNPKNSQRLILRDIREHLVPQHDAHYISYSFTVPPGASKVGAILNFTKKRDKVQLYISLHDSNGFRGHRQCPGADGKRSLEIWVSPDDAVLGGIPGTLPDGAWRVQIDFDRLFEEADYHVIVYVEYASVPEPLHTAYPENHIVKHEAGWYQGELHAHSDESDAKYPVETVVEAAVDAGLDFLALSDHYTNSHWRKLARLIQQPLALIRSCEITGHRGHANLHGIKRWVDVYVDRDDWSMTQAAQAVHEQGGLFCVNHAFSGYMAWRYFHFDWSQADLLEIYHNLEGNNNERQLALWDRLLCSGHRIVGVGGTDSHDPLHGNHKLGELSTWVYADELSEQGILEGLRRGNVYVSKGVQLRFSASCESQQAVEMGGVLPEYGIPVTFRLEVLSAEPLRLFVMKNGFLLSHHHVLPANPGQWQSVSFRDTPEQTGFYRVELHLNTERSGHTDYPDIYWHDYSTMRALSNPIWVGRKIAHT